MSTIVQMPVRVKPPPADTGEIISPGCASFEIAMPSNGARTTMSARSVRRALTLRLRDLDLLLRHRDPRLERFDLGIGRIELGAGDDLVLHQLLPAAQRQLRFLEPCLVLGGGPLRRVELRLVYAEHGPQLRVVQPREDLAALHRPAFLDEDLEDLAGHLRGHRGAAPGGHIAGGIEHRIGGAGRAAPHRRLRGLHVEHRLTPPPVPSTRGRRGQQDDQTDPDARAAAAATGLAINA